MQVRQAIEKTGLLTGSGCASRRGLGGLGTCPAPYGTVVPAAQSPTRKMIVAARNGAGQWRGWDKNRVPGF